MPFPGNFAATKIVVKAIATAGTVVAANLAPLVVLHRTDTEREKDEKAYEDRIKDQSSRPIR